MHDASTVARGMKAVISCWGGLKKANSGCRALVVGMWFPELGGVLRAKFFTFPECKAKSSYWALVFFGLAQAGQRVELRELQAQAFIMPSTLCQKVPCFKSLPSSVLNL